MCYLILFVLLIMTMVPWRHQDVGSGISSHNVHCRLCSSPLEALSPTQLDNHFASLSGATYVLLDMRLCVSMFLVVLVAAAVVRHQDWLKVGPCSSLQAPAGT